MVAITAEKIPTRRMALMGVLVREFTLERQENNKPSDDIEYKILGMANIDP